MKEFNEQRIGVFDSGVGGLTVLKELERQLPRESILYFGDTARLPYGTRSKAEILQFVLDILAWMAEEEVKMVVMACNTSSALALDEVRACFDFPILGLILPGAKAAVLQGRRIGAIATPATVASNAYRQAILEIDANVRVWQVGCPEFVPLIEENRIHHPYTRQVATAYLQPLLDNQIDTLIYGCTHYPHLAPVLKTILPPSVRLVNPADCVAKATARELQLLGLDNIGEKRPTRFCVSGDPQRFARLSQQWLSETPNVEKVYLSSARLASMPLNSVDS
ncbi:MAG: glutamate racemase [Cyanobacteria bacterium P01_E01_bin.42]